MLERLKRWRVRLYCADGWEAYAELIPQGRLHVGKEETHGIERDHSRQRHWLARSAAAPAWSPGPSTWSRPRSRSSPASRTVAGSTNSNLCKPEILVLKLVRRNEVHPIVQVDVTGN